MQNLFRISLAAFLALATIEPGYAAQQTINVGTSPNDHTGDPLRTAFQKANANFNDLYGCSPLAAGTGISISGCTISATGGGGGIPGGSNGQLQYNNNGVFGGYTVGSGLAVSGGALTATGGGSGLTIGSTTVTGGTTAYLLYNNGGVVGNLAQSALSLAWSQITGTPTTLAGYGITNGATSGANSNITSLSGLTTPLSVSQGGTGTATPGLVAGTNMSVSGTWPNQTVAASGGGSVTLNTTCPNSTQTGSTLALSGATTPTVVSAASYTLLGTNATPTDCGRPVILTNSGAVAVTLPTEGGVGFADGYVTVVSAQGAGGATITPSTGTINGGASISLVQHQSATIWGAGGAWYASVSTSGGVAGGLNASIPSGNYFYPFMGGITTGQSGVALTTNILYCTEFGQVQSNNITVKGMGAFLSTGVAASHAQFAIYSVAGGTLTYVDSTASQSTASSSVSITGALSNTTDVLLGTNLYALCLNTDTSGLVFSSALAGSPGLVMTTVGTATVGNIASVGAKSIASTFACSSSCTNGFPNTVSLGSMGDFTSKTPTLALQAN